VEQTYVESNEKARVLFKFPNGDEATNISQLATLMEKNYHDAINALYSGDLEQSFSEVEKKTLPMRLKQLSINFQRIAT